ncbi:hypothetical protein ACIGO6_00405 [Streptomyces sp. NPDC053750]|uniref:hypothetical protein n=1 Tax=Streptomyces sp. NPDC053750 TaxID=3365714 RepID=UPI0037D80D38
MQSQAGNAATVAFLSGAAPVQRAHLPVQRVDSGRKRGRSDLTEDELHELALAREARAHARARARREREDHEDLPFGPMDDPFGGHTLKKGYRGDKGPLAVTNKDQHPGSDKFGDRYWEDRPGKPAGFMSHLTNDDLGVALDVLENNPPDQDAIDSMGPTRRRASSTLYGASYSEDKRREGSNKALRSALRRQKSGKTLRKDFKDDFPMAGSVKHDGPRYGAQAYPKAQSGKVKLSTGARDTLLEMSESSDDDRGRPPLREPEIVDVRPPRRSTSVGPRSYSGREEPADHGSRRYPPLSNQGYYPPPSSRSGQIPGGSSQPFIVDAEPPREPRRSSSRHRRSRSSSRPPERQSLPLRPAPVPYPPSYGGGPPAPMPYPPSYGGRPPAPMPYPPSYGGRPPAPMPYPPSYGGGPPAPMPYPPSYGGGPPAPMPYPPSHREVEPPRSETVYMVDGLRCVRRNGQYIPIE